VNPYTRDRCATLLNLSVGQTILPTVTFYRTNRGGAKHYISRKLGDTWLQLPRWQYHSYEYA
jgi:hypothetical protein